MKIERSKTLLIVDDSQPVADLIEGFLNRRPYRVLKAYDGEDGLRRIRAEEPDLILLDINMPRLDGYGVLRELGKNYAGQVIVMTAHRETGIRNFEEYPCVKAVFTKPMSGEKLVQAIDGLIGDSEPTGEM